MEKFYAQSINDTENKLNTNIKSGLFVEQQEELLNKYGLNRLEGKKGRTLFQTIIAQFKDFLVLILIIAAGISIFLGEFVDGIVILIIIGLNAVLGVIQEKKASNALKALKEMAAPSAKVIRNSSLLKVSSSEIVPGDIVLLEAGDYIPADIRLVEAVNLKIQESALTGESVPVEKNADILVNEDATIGDHVNMAYMSTIITYGRGKGIVTATGMNTRIGNIASMIDEEEKDTTPLQKKLDQFGKKLGIACLIVCAVIFALGLLRKQEIFSIFMTAVSLAVAAIPEGLPAIVTVILALGMQKMIKRNAIVKRLSAVETLGSTTVICTDKTGTLTQNKMVVTKIFDGNSIWNVTGSGYNTAGEIKCENENLNSSENLEKILYSAVLCNDAKIRKGKDDIIGDPTEGALVVLGAKGGYPQDELNKNYPRIDEFPFDSERKLMSTLHQRKNDKIIYTKGAPDVILNRCSCILGNNRVVPIENYHKVKIQEINSTFAKQALRVLGYAYKVVNDKVNIRNEENNLIFIGLTGMMDPPRKEAEDAIKLCHRAGIRVVMITGDHKTTASAIAKKIGIIESDKEALNGLEIDKISDEDFKEKVMKTNVFARVSPEHKVRIVRAIKANDEIAAMTGDGVNDAPALKQADIGIAMGITGTDVAKEAADMVLTDDNFSSIVHTVEEGRIIYSNIRKFVGFLLSCNIGELMLIFVSMLFGWGTPLLPIQLLWINLITDSFPAFALGMETKEEGIMKKNPRDPNEPIADRKMKISIAFQSISLAVAALISYKYGMSLNGQQSMKIARTFCFITLITGELLRAYSARSESKLIFRMNFISNKYLNYSAIVSLVLLFIVIYIPTLRTVFHTVALASNELIIALLFAIIPLVGGEIAKKFK